MWFSQGVIVNWNGLPLPTTFVNAGVAGAVVDASLVAATGTATVTVTLERSDLEHCNFYHHPRGTDACRTDKAAPSG